MKHLKKYQHLTLHLDSELNLTEDGPYEVPAGTPIPDLGSIVTLSRMVIPERRKALRSVRLLDNGNYKLSFDDC